ncbi:MAG: MATE family efflux transporter [Solobacterium sp.]|nr:MATE family efflux transporter [Solobacterium sp.]
MSAKTKVMTEGNPAKIIFFFSLPLMAANVLQQVYVMTDTLIISRTLGVDALAAMASADWFSFMMISIVQALTQGFAILVAQDFGAQKLKHLQKTLATSLKLTIIFTILLTIISVLSIQPMLNLQHTPSSIAPIAYEYLYYLFLGVPAFMLFNFGSAILRAFGNAKSPMIAMVVSTIVNIGLDILFVPILGWGVKGAAIATVIAQLLSGLFCIYVIKGVDVIFIKKEDFKREKGLDEELIKLSWPLILQNLTIAIGGIFVTSKVNEFDIAHIAGFTAMNKLFGILELAAIAYGYSMITYIAQNYGAKRNDRLRSGVKASIILGVLTAFMIGVFLILFGNQLIGMFLVGEASVVSEAQFIGYDMLRLFAYLLSILYVLIIIRSILQGFGDTLMPMLSGVAELIARLFFVFVMTRFIGWEALKWSEPAAWIAADIVLIGSLLRILKQIDQKASEI